MIPMKYGKNKWSDEVCCDCGWYNKADDDCVLPAEWVPDCVLPAEWVPESKNKSRTKGMWCWSPEFCLVVGEDEEERKLK